MVIDKISLEGKTDQELYTYQKGRDADDKETKIVLSVINLDQNKDINFESKTVSSYHVLIDGKAGYSRHGEDERHEMEKIRMYNCEDKDSLKISGEGRIFSLFAYGCAKGFIRVIHMNGEKKMPVGEGVGDSVTALWGADAGFTLKTDTETTFYEKGSAAVLELQCKEFANIVIIPEKPDMKIVAAQATVMYPYDFAKFIGIQLLERQEGLCRAKLNVRPEHKNPIGTVHGGCLFTMADVVSGMAAASIGGISTTLSSNIQFLNAAFKPEYLIAEAKPVKIGHKIRNFHVDIYDDKNVQICFADFVYFSLQK